MMDLYNIMYSPAARGIKSMSVLKQIFHYETLNVRNDAIHPCNVQSVLAYLLKQSSENDRTAGCALGITITRYKCPTNFYRSNLSSSKTFFSTALSMAV